MKNLISQRTWQEENRRINGKYLSVVWLLCALPAISTAADWSQWRGSLRDGIWREDGLLTELPVGQLPLLWDVEIDGGYAAPTVSNGRVFVFDRVVSQAKQSERIHAFHSISGQELWKYRYECDYKEVDHQAGPRAAITIHDDRAYALGTMGDLVCVNVQSGELHWHKKLSQEFNIRMPMWGLSSAPLIFENLVILQIGGDDGACLVGLDRLTGALRWQSLNDNASYSSPILIRQLGRPVVVCWTGERLVGLNPATGHLYWHYRTPETKWIRNAASPVWFDEQLVISGFFSGTMLFRLHPDKMDVDLLWHRQGSDEKHTDGIHSSIAEVVLTRDHIFGVDSHGELRCLDVRTGDRVWENETVIPQQRWSTLRLIPQGERLWIFTEQGELAIGNISSSGYVESSRAQLIRPTKLQEPTRRQGVCWSYPAFADRCVFARNDEQLVCASLAAP